MCFNVSSSRSNSVEKIATKDLKCYKVLVKRKDGTLDAIYRHMDYQIGSLVYADSILKEDFKFVVTHGETDFISRGLHSKKDAADAKSLGLALKPNNMFTNYNPFKTELVIVECNIPIGAKYYENNSEYVSDRLFVKGEYVKISLWNKFKNLFIDA
jgi:hypothetical protein